MNATINVAMSDKLRIEKSINCSGKINNEHLILSLKEAHYYVRNFELDGDAPKQFIRVYYYQENSGVRKAKPGTWFPYIAKTAEKWYPHESVIEYMINRIGQELELVMNDIKLLRINGQIRFLSKYFLNENERLVHGAEICGEYLEDMALAKEIATNKQTSRELFTFEFIREAIRFVYPNAHALILRALVKMAAFDALVGNNDRHFYNWGIIDSKKKNAKLPKFAPLYDSARGLLWNLSDANIINMYKNHRQGGKKIVNYINEAHPRISVENNIEANHFELMGFLKEHEREYAIIIDQMSSEDNEKRILKMLESEFFPFFIFERCELIALILRERFKRIRGI